MLDAPGNSATPDFDGDILQGLLDTSTTDTQLDQSSFFPMSGVGQDPFDWLNDENMAADGAGLSAAAAVPAYFQDYIQPAAAGNGFTSLPDSAGPSGADGGRVPWTTFETGLPSPEQTPGMSSGSSRESSNSAAPPLPLETGEAARMTFVVDEAPPETLVEVMRVLLDSKARVEFRRG